MSRPGAATVPPTDYKKVDITGHKSAVQAIAWAAGAKRLASGSGDGVVRLWEVDPSTGSADKLRGKDNPLNELHHGSSSSKECIVALAFHPRKDDLLAVIGSNVTKVYDLRVKSASSSVVVSCNTPDAIAGAWDGHGDHLLVAQLRNTVTHIDVKHKQGHKPKVLREGDEITGIAFIESGRKLLVASRFGVEVWSWPQYEHLTTLTGAHNIAHSRWGGVTAMAVSTKDRLLASGGADASVCVWDLSTATPLTALYTPDDAVRALSFNTDQTMLACSQDQAQGQQTTLDIVDVRTGKFLYRIPMAQPSEAVAFNPRYPRLLAFAGDTVLKGRDSKGKDQLEGRVSVVVLGK